MTPGARTGFPFAAGVCPLNATMPGCQAPIPSKGKQRFGALSSVERSIELTTSVRELSGPRPFRRVVDIVFKPRIWNCGAKAISLENRPTLQVTGSGRTAISSASTVPHAGAHLDT